MLSRKIGSYVALVFSATSSLANSVKNKIRHRSRQNKSQIPPTGTDAIQTSQTIMAIRTAPTIRSMESGVAVARAKNTCQHHDTAVASESQDSLSLESDSYEHDELRCEELYNKPLELYHETTAAAIYGQDVYPFKGAMDAVITLDAQTDVRSKSKINRESQEFDTKLTELLCDEDLIYSLRGSSTNTSHPVSMPHLTERHQDKLTHTRVATACKNTWRAAHNRLPDPSLVRLGFYMSYWEYYGAVAAHASKCAETFRAQWDFTDYAFFVERCVTRHGLTEYLDMTCRDDGDSGYGSNYLAVVNDAPAYNLTNSMYSRPLDNLYCIHEDDEDFPAYTTGYDTR